MDVGVTYNGFVEWTEILSDKVKHSISKSVMATTASILCLKREMLHSEKKSPLGIGKLLIFLTQTSVKI